MNLLEMLQVVERWSKRKKWCLDKLTLNGSLPLDEIETVELSKTFNVLEISGNRYYKIYKDSSTNFSTRLVSNRGVYSKNIRSSENNVELLKKAGFLEHENCILYLANWLPTIASKADAELHKTGSSEVNIMCKDKKDSNVDRKRTLL